MTVTGATERTEAPTSDRVNATYLAQWVTTQAALHRVPGVQYAVAVDDEVVLDGAWGVTDLTSGTPLRPDHLFRVASHSKTFTATTVARLVDAGELRWDDALGAHVPELGRTSAGEITVREALGHTGGLLRDGRDADFWQLALPFPDRAALLDAVLTDGEVYGRGEAFKYSNLAYGLLGLVVEAVTGERFTDHVRHALLEPLGLDDTFCELTDEISRRAVVGHSAPAPAEPGLRAVFADGRLPVAATTTGALAAATGFCSTARDLVRWASAHCDGATLLRPETRRLLQREESVVERPHSRRRAYGLGFELRDVDGRRLVGHSGGFPGQITRTWFDPTSRVAVSVLTNAIDGPADQLALGLFALVTTALAGDHGGSAAGSASGGATGGGGSDDGAPAGLDRWTGRFANLWGRIDLVRLGGHLWSIDPLRADPLDGAERLRVDGDALRPAPHGGFGPVGEPVHVLRDADGAPSGVVVGGMTSWPAEEFERQQRASTPR
jgi:D-alanyl-D-alanine carboxypeptidase